MDIFWNYTLYKNTSKPCLIDDHYKFQGIIYMLQYCQTTVQLWYNEGQCDWQSMFAITRFCCIKVLFSIVYCY